MKKLLELAAAKGCRAEVYSVKNKSLGMDKTNGAVSDVSASIQSGISLRVIRDGKTGMAFTKNLIDREELVLNALASLEAGVDAEFDFPASGSMEYTREYDGSVEEKNYEDLAATIKGMEPLYSDAKDGVLSVRAGTEVVEIRIMNTSGADLVHRESAMYGVGSILYPGTSTGLRNVFVGRSGVEFNPGDIARTVDFYNSSLPVVEIPEGRMKVLLAPEVLYAFTWRLSMGASGKSFHEKVSPLLEKRGKQVLSREISIISDPRKGTSGTRAFDDEGVAARAVPIFDRGVFSSVYNNLNYASKLGEEPTGTGFRGGMWGGDRVSLNPSPSLSHGGYSTGDASFSEMLESMDRGVIVYGALGAHSGNILNGDLSIGLSPGLYVENGKIMGRVKDGMMAGNVYEMLSRVISVENRSHYTGSMYENPVILLDEVSVVGS